MEVVTSEAASRRMPSAANFYTIYITAATYWMQKKG